MSESITKEHEALEIVKRHIKISSMYDWHGENGKITLDTNNVIYMLDGNVITKEEYDTLKSVGFEEE